MNKDPFLKLQSSKLFEELINETESSRSQNWLLSYLDVFVLMVMLITTLVTFSDLTQTRAEAPDTSVTPHTIPTSTPEPKLTVKLVQPTPLPPPVIPLIPTEPVIKQGQEPAEPKPTQPIAIPPLPLSNSTAETVQTEAEGEATESEQQALENKLIKKLDQLGLNEKISLKVTNDYTQLEIQDNILFQSSQASLTTSGMALLNSLMPLLENASGLIFIEGHTDNRPINTPQFPSNWELGSARATSVLHYLTTQGLENSRLRAITYADTMPIADNETPEGREKNRRVNLLIKVHEQNL